MRRRRAFHAGSSPVRRPRPTAIASQCARFRRRRPSREGIADIAAAMPGTISSRAPAPAAAEQAQQHRFGQHQAERLAVARSPVSSASPISGMRSRTDCAMVLPVTSRMVKNTAPRMACTMKPMSPICLMKFWLNAFSDPVLVSFCELAKRRSTSLGDRGGLRRIGDARDVDAGRTACERPRLVEVVPMEQQRALLAPRGLILAHECPTSSNSQSGAVRLGPDRAPGLESCRPPSSRNARPATYPTTAPVRVLKNASRCSGAIRNSGYMSR